MKMITGDIPITNGNVFISGSSLTGRISAARKVIGYCPQFDALLEHLTGADTLGIFGLLRGYRRSNISKMIDQVAKDLKFTDDINKKIHTYSNNNKRKLSTAIAIMGNPLLIYLGAKQIHSNECFSVYMLFSLKLDEPSSGLDPASKRILWSAVVKARHAGGSVILTSHSMEEVEATCTRAGIMVDGEFKCLGAIQSLKNQAKLPTGYNLSIKVRTSPGRFNKLDPDIVLMQVNHYINLAYEKRAVLT